MEKPEFWDLTEKEVMLQEYAQCVYDYLRPKPATRKPVQFATLLPVLNFIGIERCGVGLKEGQWKFWTSEADKVRLDTFLMEIKNIKTWEIDPRTKELVPVHPETLKAEFRAAIERWQEPEKRSFLKLIKLQK